MVATLVTTFETSAVRMIHHSAGRYSFRQVIVAVGAIYFAGLFLVFLVPESAHVLGSVPGRSLSPLHWYSMLTYSVLHASLIHWLQVMVFTAASLVVLVPRLRIRTILVIWAGSSIVGGVTYAVLASNTSPAIGGGMVSFGLAGAVVGVWLRQRSTFGRLANVYAIVLLPGVIGTAFLGVTPQDRGMLVAALFSAAYTYRIPVSAGGMATEDPDSTPAALSRL